MATQTDSITILDTESSLALIFAKLFDLTESNFGPNKQALIFFSYDVLAQNRRPNRNEDALYIRNQLLNCVFKNILVAVECSENSDTAFETAVEFTSPRALWVEER